MTVRSQTWCLALIALAVIAGPGPAQAADDPFGDVPPPRTRVVRRPVRVLPPLAPAIVSGYLPRNNAVPMYNEPPRWRPQGLPFR